MEDEANQISGPYIKWHYSRGIKEVVNTAENFIRFLFHFFSLKLLFSTLFSPWRRLHENYNKADLGDMASSLLVNFIMRIVGFISRMIIILIGVLCIISAALLALVAFAAWLFYPFLILAVLSSGVILIMSGL
jgi:hypothetical protein